MSTTTSIDTRTVEAPGATITYDVHGDLASGTPLLLIGCPMDASGFGSLAARFADDRPVITYDPRGTGRSTRSDGGGTLEPQQHADDLALVVDQLDAGPVDVFASSGGAVNALAWVAARPEQVRTLIAHEPPLAAVLPDREALTAAVNDMMATYQAKGQGPGMAKFITLVMHDGPLPEGYRLPDVDPAQFGMTADDDGSRDDPLLGQNVHTTTYEPDLDALRAAGTRLVLARGEESGDTMAARGASGVAEQLGERAELVTFPSDHAGFLDGEYGQRGKPVEFAARLREVLQG